MRPVLLAAAVLLSSGAAPLPVKAQPLVVTGDVPAETGARRVEWVSGLEHPWGMAFLPDGRMLVTERPGRLRIVEPGGRLVAAPVEGVPAVLARGQGGLLDVTIHPRFAENGLVYLSYAAGTPDANRLTVARGRLVGDRLEDVRVILENPTPKRGGAHFGSRFAWKPDGTLLVSVGDGGNPPIRLGEGWIREQAQNRDAWFGKLILARDDGSNARVFSLGHRNVQGLAVAPDGRIWATEHGALGGDELNLVREGANFGWPRVTHSREYTGPAISEATSAPGMTDPVLVWQNATAPSGLAIYRGTRFSGWQGDILSGGLLSQDVRRIRVDAAGRVLGQTRIGISQRVRDVRVGPDGFIYVLTDERQGRIFRVEPASAS